MEPQPKRRRVQRFIQQQSSERDVPVTPLSAGDFVFIRVDATWKKLGFELPWCLAQLPEEFPRGMDTTQPNRNLTVRVCKDKGYNCEWRPWWKSKPEQYTEDVPRGAVEMTGVELTQKSVLSGPTAKVRLKKVR